IAIARAFLKDSPVLILDEPTSAVDQEAETAIVDAVQRLMRGRTVILITHRPQLLERCSALVVLEHGRLASSTTLSPALSGTPAAPTPVAERRASLMRHPAVVAWCRLPPDAEPQRITPLKVRRKKNQVYRLDGIGWAGGSVIAKRCPKAVALVERTVYEEILPGPRSRRSTTTGSSKNPMASTPGSSWKRRPAPTTQISWQTTAPWPPAGSVCCIARRLTQPPPRVCPTPVRVAIWTCCRRLASSSTSIWTIPCCRQTMSSASRRFAPGSMI